MTNDSAYRSSAGSAVFELSATGIDSVPFSATFCPECGRQGKAVQGQTVKASLVVSLASVQNAQYFFCPTESCSIVYYTGNAGSTYRVSDLRERVYQKEPDSVDVLICYCFMHTAEAVRSAAAHLQAAILDDINAGVEADLCACDLRNPQGLCCLGNVHALIKQARSVPKEP